MHPHNWGAQHKLLTNIDNFRQKELLCLNWSAIHNFIFYFAFSLGTTNHIENFILPDIALPNASNLGSTAENGLHFLYDRVLNWVRQGEVHQPSLHPTPLPRETKTSARRKAMAHHSSVESIVEELEKENEARYIFPKNAATVNYILIL